MGDDAPLPRRAYQRTLKSQLPGPGHRSLGRSRSMAWLKRAPRGVCVLQLCCSACRLLQLPAATPQLPAAQPAATACGGLLAGCQPMPRRRCQTISRQFATHRRRRRRRRASFFCMRGACRCRSRAARDVRRDAKGEDEDPGADGRGRQHGLWNTGLPVPRCVLCTTSGRRGRLGAAVSGGVRRVWSRLGGCILQAVVAGVDSW